jgi:hypothetical protein
MANMVSAEKICQYCGKTVYKDKERPTDWARKKFCSVKCSHSEASARYREKHSKTEEYRRYQREYLREYSKTEKYKSHKREYVRRKLVEDVQYRITHMIRIRIREALKCKSIVKTESVSECLGCSFSELKKWLESQFVHGMSWNNYGQWHIDHVKPLALFDLSNPVQFRDACHYTNLQPLWAIDNLKKGTRYEA